MGRSMTKEPDFHVGIYCSDPLFGYLLEPGDILEATDMFDSTVGQWRACPCPGLKIQNVEGIVWVRPVTDETLA